MIKGKAGHNSNIIISLWKFTIIVSARMYEYSYGMNCSTDVVGDCGTEIEDRRTKINQHRTVLVSPV